MGRNTKTTSDLPTVDQPEDMSDVTLSEECWKFILKDNPRVALKIMQWGEVWDTKAVIDLMERMANGEADNVSLEDGEVDTFEKIITMLKDSKDGS